MDRATSAHSSMRKALRVLPVSIAAACSGQGVTNLHSLAPPTLQVTGTSRVVSSPTVPDLEVSALLHNTTRVRIQVAVGAQCPLFVRLFPDASGQPLGSLDPSMACAPGGSSLDLAPGDSAVLTRIIPGDSLTAFASGTYGVNIAVTTSTGLLGAWAGAVQLPLALAP